MMVDEVVLVDGQSIDGTIEIATGIRPDVVVVHETQPGKGAALRAGFQAASGEYVVMLDADGSMDPVEIPAFVRKLDAGADLVRGSRFCDGGGTADISPLRSVGNRVLLGIANSIFGTANTDLCYGFAAFRRSAVLGLELDARGFEIEAQLFLRATRHGLRVVEVGSFEAPRRFGASNLHAVRDGWRVLRTILAERLRSPSTKPQTRGTERFGTEHLFEHLADSNPVAGWKPPRSNPGTGAAASLIRERRIVVETVSRDPSD